MARDIKDKIVVITGGAGGIGFAIADNFLQKNAAVAILLDLNEELGDKAVYSLISKHGKNKAVFLKCDITKDLQEAFNKIIQVYKTVDVLVNSAGVTIGLQPNNEAMNRKTIEVNATALILWCLKFWEYMRKDKGGNGGTIINIASIYGYKTNPTVPVYQATKFAVVGLTKSLGHEYNLETSGVRVVAICPGFTETKLTANLKVSQVEKKLQDDVEERLKSVIWQKPDDVGRASVEIFEQVNSGTLWSVEGGKPIVQVL